MFDHILIACDDSALARRAFVKGIELAVALKSKVTLVSVLEPLPGYYGMATLVDPTATSRRSGGRPRSVRRTTNEG